MNIGVSVNPMEIGGLAGTIDQIRQIADAGLHTAWLAQIFGPDALTVVAGPVVRPGSPTPNRSPS